MPPRPWTPENVADYARSIDGVSIIAHPYRQYGMGELARNYKVDAIEVLNGGSSASANDEAKELAKSLGLPGTAGSDAHQLSELFSVNCKVDASLDVDSVLKAIKKGSISAQCHAGVNTFLKPYRFLFTSLNIKIRIGLFGNWIFGRRQRSWQNRHNC